MVPATQQRFLALLKPLFPDGATMRALPDTERDGAGGELHRIRIDWAYDAINLRIPREFVDAYGDGDSTGRKRLEEKLATYVNDQRRDFRSNSGPRLGRVVEWTFRA
jgi:hypothetical protein